MNTSLGHLCYCTNIHPGEDWNTHFKQLKQHLPQVKAAISPDKPLGVGLRTSNLASLELLEGQRVQLKEWMRQTGLYVFTLNGFPYGGFHENAVKTQVHIPDWFNTERLHYTIRLIDLLSYLLPDGMSGGISTSPLSYRHWHGKREQALQDATQPLLDLVVHLDRMHQKKGQLIHLDIEPEPDGLLETTAEFVDFYKHWLIPMGKERFGREAEKLIRDHIQICYDVCHAAVAFENTAESIGLLQSEGIQIGKIQLSAALRAPLMENPEQVLAQLSAFDEPVYLHQVVALDKQDKLHRFADLPLAFHRVKPHNWKEWRSHFHVPLFMEQYGDLYSTQPDLLQILSLQRSQPLTQHLEVETYTWEVLPPQLKLPITESIVREMTWVKAQLSLT
jgi:hypothetical protein